MAEQIYHEESANVEEELFKKYPASRTFYAQAPRELRVDPVFCPWRRRQTWGDFKAFGGKTPHWLNYPLLDALDEDESITEGYVIRVANTTISQFEGVPDLACRMLVKIMKLLRACIEIFPQVLDQHKAP